MTLRARLVAGLGVLAALAGCAGTNGAPPQGWVAATITRVGDDLPPPPFAAEDCRRSAPDAGGRYAEVVLHEHHTRLHRIVRLPGEGAFGPGDRVQVNLDDCALPAVPLPG